MQVCIHSRLATDNTNIGNKWGIIGFYFEIDWLELALPYT